MRAARLFLALAACGVAFAAFAAAPQDALRPGRRASSRSPTCMARTTRSSSCSGPRVSSTRSRLDRRRRGARDRRRFGRPRSGLAARARARSCASSPRRRRRAARAQLVLGNHEVMNLVGELGYVSADDFAAYAAEESAAERAAAWQRFRTAHAPGVDDALAAEFAKLYPPGFFGQRAAFATRGTLGAWLLRQPVLLVLGDTRSCTAGCRRRSARRTRRPINARYAARAARLPERARYAAGRRRAARRGRVSRPRCARGGVRARGRERAAGRARGREPRRRADRRAGPRRAADRRRVLVSRHRELQRRRGARSRRARARDASA